MKTTLTLITTLGATSLAWSVPNDFSPFPPDREPPPYAVRECTNYGRSTATSDDCEFDFALSPDSCPRVMVRPNSTGSTVTLKGKDNAVLTSCSCSTYSAIALAYALDLNGDQTTDFVVQIWSNGCGLAGEISFVVFFLSDRDKYVSRQITCYDACPQDFVDLNDDGKPEFIHTAFVHGDTEKASDTRTHNYYVYNILRFEGTALVSGNSLNTHFPAWIQYKFKPNHKNTDLLTADQRIRLWRRTWSGRQVPGEQDPLPHLAVLEKEQARTAPKPAASQPTTPPLNGSPTQ